MSIVPISILKKKLPRVNFYSKKEYYENGSIKAEGTMKFSKAMIDYQKDGDWIVYDEKGNPSKEKWVNGEEQKAE